MLVGIYERVKRVQLEVIDGTQGALWSLMVCAVAKVRILEEFHISTIGHFKESLDVLGSSKCMNQRYVETHDVFEE